MTDWHLIRPYRDKNPGDLRTLPSGEHWYGQTATDTAPGGPFAIFAVEADGWGALATCLLAYQDIHGLHTLRGMIARYAPAFENDTGGYISGMCRQLGVGADDGINVHTYATMMALCTAISKMEGGSAIVWDGSARTAGIMSALSRGARGVVPHAPMHPVMAAPVQHAAPLVPAVGQPGADALMAAELDDG